MLTYSYVAYLLSFEVGTRADELFDHRHVPVRYCPTLSSSVGSQGYLAHKKPPTPLGPPQGPRQSPTIGS